MLGVSQCCLFYMKTYIVVIISLPSCMLDGEVVVGGRRDYLSSDHEPTEHEEPYLDLRERELHHT